MCLYICLQVWDVRRGMLLAVYGEHFGRLLSVEWSATDADVVCTGSDDHTVHVWRVSQHRWNDCECVCEHWLTMLHQLLILCYTHIY